MLLQVNINIDDDNWGDSKEWKEKYDNAIGNYFKNYLAGINE